VQFLITWLLVLRLAAISAVPKTISEALQDFDFGCTQGFYQSDVLLESHLATSSKQTLNCEADVRELWKGPSAAALFCFRFATPESSA
jgi:hypothetical protein